MKKEIEILVNKKNQLLNLLSKVPGVLPIVSFDMQEKRKIIDNQIRENPRNGISKNDWQYGHYCDLFESNEENYGSPNRNYTKIYTATQVNHGTLNRNYTKIYSTNGNHQ